MTNSEQNDQDKVILKLFLKSHPSEVTEEEVAYFREHQDLIDERQTSGDMRHSIEYEGSILTILDSMLDKILRLALPSLMFFYSAIDTCDAAEANTAIKQTIRAGQLSLSFDSKGALVRIGVGDESSNLAVESEHRSLVGLVGEGGEILNPVDFKTDPDSKQIRYFFDDEISVEIRFEAKRDYLVFEITNVKNEGKTEIAALFWRLNSRLRATVAESAGIIYDDAVALGIQGLNTKTCGGWLEHFDPPTEIAKWHQGMRTPYERAAIPTKFGSQLRAYSGNFSRPWVRKVGKIDGTEIPPLPREDVGDDGNLVGSRIALYGCHPKRILEVIEKIVQTEDLPYPTFGGAWFRSPAGRQRALLPYYEVGRFTPHKFDELVELARRLGVGHIYGDGAFVNFQGDFRLKNFEGRNEVFRKQIADRLERIDITTGAHGRSVEIDPRLPIVQGAKNIRANAHFIKRVPLIAPLTKDQAGPLPVAPGALSLLSRMVMIDDEVIYVKKDKRAKSGENIIEVRGAQGTKASAHKTGAMVALISTQNDQLTANWDYIFRRMLPEFIALCNDYGLGKMGWDGNLSAFYHGYGSYLVNEMQDRFFRSLKNVDNRHHSGAQITPYTWHFTTHRGGGGLEPPGELKSYTNEFLKGNDYHKRNFMIRVAGAKIGRDSKLRDAHWFGSKLAAWNAAFRISQLKDNPNRFKIADIIREWTTARDANAFPQKLREQMAAYDTWWKLVPVEPSIRWKLEQYEVEAEKETLIHSQSVVAPGIVNLAKNATIHASCLIDKPDEINDAKVASIATLSEEGAQYVQLDLGKVETIDQIRLWHQFADGRCYRDVIVQLSNDPEFEKDVTTVFNNDQDNSSGQGAGKDVEYGEPFRGKTILCPGNRARYVRAWSNGNDSDAGNHYAEIQVLSGRPTYPEYLSSDVLAKKTPKKDQSKEERKAERKKRRKAKDEADERRSSEP